MGAADRAVYAELLTAVRPQQTHLYYFQNACMKLLWHGLLTCILPLFAGLQPVQAQNCPVNMDFELGNFSNWQCYTGVVSDDGVSNIISLTPSPPMPGRHQLISAATIPAADEYGGFPKRCPFGGNYTVKLGNDSSGSQAEGLAYTFQVPAGQDTFTFTYYYAVVFEDPNHQPFEQPRFFVKAYDALNGDVINCASYSYVAGSGLPGFQISPVNMAVLYRSWVPASIQFSGMANRLIKLEFKTADCTLGGHFGYAYVDVSSNCTNILANAPFCAQNNAVMLNAPFGFRFYTWYNSDYSQVLGHQQSLLLSPGPANNPVYHVDMEPYPGYGCRDTASVVPAPLAVPPVPDVNEEYNYCRNAVAQPLLAVATPDHTLVWYSSATGGTGSALPPVPATHTAGITYYYVTQRNILGCEADRVRITVIVHPRPDITLRISDSCVHVPVQMEAMETGGLAVQWNWNLGGGFFSGPGTVTHTYTTPGPKALKLIGGTGYGCADTVSYPLIIYENTAFAGNDTSAAVNEPLQLNAGGGAYMQYLWSPPDGLSSTVAENPVAILDRDQVYTLRAVSDKGCMSNSSILVKRFVGPELYVPGAFTPNADGRNDVLFVTASGVPRLLYFKVFNRYGQEVFSTGNLQRGWNGAVNGVNSPAGAYVYTAEGVDFKGRKIFRKGTVLLIR
jgi:gliding motility-associated-like protein